MAKVVWTEKASSHLQAIYEYIAHDSPVYADRFVRSLVKATEKLESMPSCGRIVPEFNDVTIREIIYQNYRIVYSHRQARISILAVIHAARDFSQLIVSEWEV
jgi:plasmid stabilization system protein ParE